MHKLATTPMPFPFLQMLLGLMYLWMFTVPFPLAIAYGWASPAISMLLGVALFGINSIGAELEDPLGEETNDLPLELYEAAAQQSAVANNLGWPGPLGNSENPLAAHKSDLTDLAADPQVCKYELLNKGSYLDMSPEVQEFMRSYFERYDLNQNQRIDTEKELEQLVTNLNYRLQFPSEDSVWLQQEALLFSHANPRFSLDLADFTGWYCQLLQRRFSGVHGNHMGLPPAGKAL
eukprot:TRINITY_DN26807_c0_g1_i1.p1 TRINITY_DN26807_c0_g1~~TRINITY_DN26807_c0_g1_i1.p1  ORF type:complete len:234 (-),score=47.11 TRINITY_DN26807_c0_g1_i1:225-926(-)